MLEKHKLDARRREMCYNRRNLKKGCERREAGQAKDDTDWICVSLNLRVLADVRHDRAADTARDRKSVV